MHKPPPLRKNYETDNGYPWIVVYLILFIWLFFNLVMAAKHAQGATIYAAPLSTECRPSNPGTGTQGDPYRSVHYALVEGVSCGDTLRLLAGYISSTIPRSPTMQPMSNAKRLVMVICSNRTLGSTTETMPFSP